MFFKLLPGVGCHAETVDGKVVTYLAEDGCVIESEVDLVEMFPNKFEQVDIPPKTGAAPADSPSAKDIPGPDEPDVPKAPESTTPPGRDVTKRFPRAMEDDFKVFADGGAFYVVDADDPTIPLHLKPLKKDGVEPFIEEYLKA